MRNYDRAREELIHHRLLETRPRSIVKDAALVTASMLLTYLFVATIGAFVHAPQTLAVSGAVLALTLGRRPIKTHTPRVVTREFALLAAVAVAAAIVASLLRSTFAVGAIVFVAGMYLAVYLRQFGPAAREAARLLALPLVAILIVPVARLEHVAPFVAIVANAAVAMLALAVVLAVQSIAVATHFVPMPAHDRYAYAAPKRLPRGLVALSPTSRLALQMAVGLALAFAIGRVLFADHLTWVVLTAFIVQAGNRGRGDVLHKSGNRLIGALGGTAVAALCAHVLDSRNDFALGCVIFGALFGGLWLRERSYAYWAFAMTLVIALLQSTTQAHVSHMLQARLLAIVLGAGCGVFAAWFVFPIRVERAIIGRLADVLRALDSAMRALPGDEREASFDRFERGCHELVAIAVSERAHLRFFARAADRAEHPARLVEHATACGPLARRYGGDRANVVRAIGESRRALAVRARGAHGERESQSLGAALARLREILETERA